MKVAGRIKIAQKSKNRFTVEGIWWELHKQDTIFQGGCSFHLLYVSYKNVSHLLALKFPLKLNRCKADYFT